ncbi:tyrosine phosphatase-like protein, PTPLA [Dictyocaulus viviparus]|uniref:Very-long-chain (3R)-3-hydroxyacyl-CoA dehydratase n=1 Tax=Dictyocaulus viviparus TaxID=29172 RepID=A0A0D8XBT3_DICVI|nr:tyrosine phosphatase-like protein, PTPLA [Dictyocaulus viviparus]
MKININRTLLLKLYKFLYNVTLFSIHLMIFLKLVEAQISERFVFLEFFPLYQVATYAQILDVFHGIIGITNTGMSESSIQIFGRIFMLYVIEGNPMIHNQLETIILLYAWVLIELFRYPYYALRSWNSEIYLLTWLRYSAWIPLYPIGLFIEWLSMVSSLKFYYRSSKYSLQIPYLQFSLNFGIVLSVLSFLVMPFISRKLIVHMSKQRKKKLYSGKNK